MFEKSLTPKKTSNDFEGQSLLNYIRGQVSSNQPLSLGNTPRVKQKTPTIQTSFIHKNSQSTNFSKISSKIKLPFFSTIRNRSQLRSSSKNISLGMEEKEYYCVVRDIISSLLGLLDNAPEDFKKKESPLILELQITIMNINNRKTEEKELSFLGTTKKIHQYKASGKNVLSSEEKKDYFYIVSNMMSSLSRLLSRGPESLKRKETHLITKLKNSIEYISKSIIDMDNHRDEKSRSRSRYGKK